MYVITKMIQQIFLFDKIKLTKKIKICKTKRLNQMYYYNRFFINSN